MRGGRRWSISPLSDASSSVRVTRRAKEIVFNPKRGMSAEEAENYERLYLCDVFPTKFLDPSTLEQLGLYEPMEIIFDKLGLREMRVNPPQTFVPLTLEFRATVKQFTPNEPKSEFAPSISFRLSNEYHILAYAKLRRDLSLDDLDEIDQFGET